MSELNFIRSEDGTIKLQRDAGVSSIIPPVEDVYPYGDIDDDTCEEDWDDDDDWFDEDEDWLNVEDEDQEECTEGDNPPFWKVCMEAGFEYKSIKYYTAANGSLVVYMTRGADEWGDPIQCVLVIDTDNNRIIGVYHIEDETPDDLLPYDRS